MRLDRLTNDVMVTGTNLTLKALLNVPTWMALNITVISRWTAHLRGAFVNCKQAILVNCKIA